jgi:hypothetical protein
MSSEAGVEMVTDWREKGPHPLEFGVDGLMQPAMGFSWPFVSGAWMRKKESKEEWGLV